MKHLSVLIKPASSLCNLRCKYCFYADVSDSREIRSYGIMSHETMTGLVDRIFDDLENGDTLTLAFQGGEPTLAGLLWFEEFVACVKAKPLPITLNLSLQTNGILLDDSWCFFLKKHHFLVGLSWDGHAALHNQNRVTPQGQGTWSAVRTARELLLKHGVEHNILCVLTNEAARYPRQLWNFIEAQNIDYIQIIPCLDDLDGNGKNQAITPKRFCSFYTSLFDLWHRSVRSGKYVSVKLFDDIANLFLYRRVTSCGMTGRCSMQFVVEADGSVYPCDFFVLDEYRLGNLTQQSPAELYREYLAKGISAPRAELPGPCGTCPYLSVCRGGCRRMEHSIYTDGSYCGYRALLDRILEPLCQDARYLASL